MKGTEITAWADGYGNWHAKVSTTDAVNMACERMALATIRAALAEREGPNFAPEVVGVRLESWDRCPYDIEVWQYVETNAHDADS